MLDIPSYEQRCKWFETACSYQLVIVGIKAGFFFANLGYL